MRAWSWPLVVLSACAFTPRGQVGDDDGDAAATDAAEIDAEVADAPDAAMIDAPDAGVDAPDAGDAAAIDAPDAADDAATAIDAPDAPTDAPGPIVDRTLRDDTAAELGAGPPALVDGRIDAIGVFAPHAYYLGGLCATGSNSRLFDDGHTATWPALGTPARPGLARFTDLEVVSGGVPTGVGIVDPADWTLMLEGEVYLAAGAHSITLLADDHGLVELAAPGGAFTKLVGVNTADGEQSASFVAAAGDGWYGIRYAVAQETGAVDLYVKVDGQKLSRLVTRCRIDTTSGLAEVATDQSQLLDVRGTTIDGTPQVANVDWGTNRPTDLGLTSSDTFAVRWSGQLRIDIPGTFTFRIDSDDGHRMWLDGAKVLDVFDDAPHNDTTAPVALTAGWHDVVVEYSENTGGARVALTVAAGPELVGAAIPASRFRAAEARSQRFDAVSMIGPVPIAGSATLRIAAPAGALVAGVDVGYRITHPNIFGVASTLAHAGTTVTLRNAGSGSTLDRAHPAGFDGLAAAGDWTLAFTDIGAQMGTLDQAWLTVHYADPMGAGPIAPSARLESSVRDLLAPAGGAGQVISIGQLRFAVRAVTGGAAAMYVRTCDLPGDCAAQPWSGPYASGASPGVVPRRYLQYAFALTSDTDHEPALDRIEIDYQTQ